MTQRQAVIGLGKQPVPQVLDADRVFADQEVPGLAHRRPAALDQAAEAGVGLDLGEGLAVGTDRVGRQPATRDLVERQSGPLLPLNLKDVDRRDPHALPPHLRRPPPQRPRPPTGRRHRPA
jgi:hypothetical protein